MSPNWRFISQWRAYAFTLLTLSLERMVIINLFHSRTGLFKSMQLNEWTNDRPRSKRIFKSRLTQNKSKHIKWHLSRFSAACEQKDINGRETRVGAYDSAATAIAKQQQHFTLNCRISEIFLPFLFRTIAYMRWRWRCCTRIEHHTNNILPIAYAYFINWIVWNGNWMRWICSKWIYFCILLSLNCGVCVLTFLVSGFYQHHFAGRNHAMAVNVWMVGC